MKLDLTIREERKFQDQSLMADISPVKGKLEMGGEKCIMRRLRRDGWRKMHNEKIKNLYASSGIVRMMSTEM
jgi:hypothetical protein